MIHSFKDGKFKNMTPEMLLALSERSKNKGSSRTVILSRLMVVVGVLLVFLRKRR